MASRGSVLLDRMLVRLRECGLLKERGQQRTDATHVLAAVRQVNRLEMIGETLRAALNALAGTRSRLVDGAGHSGLVRALFRPGRDVAPAQGGDGAASLGRCHGRRRSCSPGGGLFPGRADQPARSAGRADAPSHLDPAIPHRGRSGPPAAAGRHPAHALPFQHALRYRRAFRQEAGHDVDRLQGAPVRDV